MRIETDLGTVEVVDEPMYSFDSSDNARAYRFARNFATNGKATSAHGVLLNGQAIAVFGKNGGCTGVHAHSAVYERGLMYLAVGDSAVCVRLNPFEFKWIAQVDSATCFGIHRHAGHQALISHGELEIARLSKDGDLLWSSSGADIFSEGFRFFRIASRLSISMEPCIASTMETADQLPDEPCHELRMCLPRNR